MNLKCYLCNSLRGSMIKFSSCNKAKVYFGSVLETLIHDQLSLWALWWHSDYGGSGWQRRTCLMEPGVKFQRAGIPISLLGYPMAQLL